MIYKKFVSFVLIGFLFSLACHTSVRANPEKEIESAVKVKSAVAELGVGPEARIAVKLRDKTKVKGYISEIGADNFTVTDKNNVATSIPYSQAKQVKGKNNLTGKQIGFGIAVAVAILSIILLAQD